MKYTIGLSGYFHDSSVCLLDGGSIVEFVREETLTRVKGTNQFPHRALRFLIDKYNLDDTNVDFICFYEKPLRGWFSGVNFSLKHPLDRMELLKNQLKQFWSGPANVSQKILKVLKIDERKILFAPHHLSHVLSATPFQKGPSTQQSLHFVFDAVGDGICSSIFYGSPSYLQILRQDQYPNSLGLFYSAVTEYCGFNTNEGEFKLMALAAYGKPIHSEFLLKNVIRFSSPELKLNLKWFNFHRSVTTSYSELFLKKFGPAAKESDLIEDANRFKDFADLAASAQDVTERIICRTISWGIEQTGITSITVSGGVAQNCVAMHSASKLVGVCDFTVPPSPGDSGAAIGAANFAEIMANRSPVKIHDIAFGGSFSQPKSGLFEELFQLVAKENAYAEVAELINNGNIICTFIGGNEIGPRALGFRSIICSAGKAPVVQRLNTLIKKRESFRPLAPAMTSETAENYFHLNKNALRNYNWMGLIAFAKPELPSQYNCCLHVDGSARLQILEKDISPLYEILELAEDEILLNTSFNISGDPIVGDYFDCYVNMQRMGLEYLITDKGLYKLII